ncbi:hypothetical protein EMPS_03995 [Entomortierella parvispora]|uniref:Crinkler effector protein N-terminal domain-containing protein n=1 Tax=Entomortierella parvispora TaxID=205924 RepID=A0A9P3H7W7_9FUNG|nr:hypothetical protein EMPS_03995 [Entomortierella parvispora]
MTENLLTLFCLIDGEASPFSVKASPHDTVDDLKNLIKTKKTPRLDALAADELTLWRVSLPIDDAGIPAPLGSDFKKKRLKVSIKLSSVFTTELSEDTIHVLVQRPSPDKDQSPVTSGKVYVVHSYKDYRKEVFCEILDVYGDYEDAVAFAETICVPEGSHEDTKHEYVYSKGCLFDRRLAGWGDERVAISEACHYTRQYLQAMPTE